MKFKVGNLYREVLDISFGALNEYQLHVAFSDGRAAAIPMYLHLISKFSNVLEEKNEFSETVVLDNDEIYLIRIVTKNGTLTSLAKQNGTRRQYTDEEMQVFLKRVSGFLFVDVTQFPSVVYGAIKKSLVPKVQRMDYSDSVALMKLSLRAKQ